MEEKEVIMFTLFRDHKHKSFLIVPSIQLDIFYAIMDSSEIERLVEDDDLEYLEAVGPILI